MKRHITTLSLGRARARSSWYKLPVLGLLALLAACGTPSTTGGTTPGSTATHITTPIPTATPFRVGPDADNALGQCYKSSFGGCFSPEEVQTFYNLNPLYAKGYDGSGETIVIVLIGGSPTIKNDLHVFDQTFGLPDPPSFQIITPFAGDISPAVQTTNSPEVALSAASETTLDIEWAHAIAPGANLVLLLSSADTLDGYRETFSYGITQALGQVFSYSIGVGEPTLDDSCNGTRAQVNAFDQQVFQAAVAAHITMLAPSGDDGPTNPDCNGVHNFPYPNIGWPASNPLVTAVGGTKMTLKDDSGNYEKESVWNQGGASGGGTSQFYSEPDWQKNLPNQDQLNGKRTIPDVSWGAAANFPTYSSYSGTPGWRANSGTSVSTPQWAGLVAIANQMAGKPLGFINPALYKLAGKGFHDITSGDNSDHGVTGFQAVAGWDMSTGWGTPDAAVLVPLLITTVEQLGS